VSQVEVRPIERKGLQHVYKILVRSQTVTAASPL
jgi:hypothetical protein